MLRDDFEDAVRHMATTKASIPEDVQRRLFGLHGRSQHPQAGQWQKAYQQRLDAAEFAGRTVHQREHARYLLQVDPSPTEALAVARDNWQQQKELTDLRLLLAAATA